jgi:hypothetical protein
MEKQNMHTRLLPPGSWGLSGRTRTWSPASLTTPPQLHLCAAANPPLLCFAAAHKQHSTAQKGGPTWVYLFKKNSALGTL